MKRKVIATFLGVLAVQPSWAAGAGKMPWDGPLREISQDLSGPTVVAIAIIAMVVTAMVIAFEGGLPEWGKKVAILALAVSIAVGASAFLLTVFNVNSALI